MGAAATGFPLLPSGYVAGTITISSGQAGTPQQLLTLIQTQLDANCPGAGQEVTLQADGNSGALYVGRANLVGALSTSNYGYVLQPGNSRTYRSSFPGNSSPVGDLQVFMVAAGVFHVEVH